MLRWLWRRRSRLGQFAATLAVSVGLLWLTLYTVDFGQIGDTFRRANPIYLLPIAATFAVQYWLIAVRWQQLVLHLRPVSVRAALPRVLIASSARAVAPFLLDQLLMVQISARAFGIGRAELSGAEFISRLMEGFVYALFLLTTILVLPVGPAFIGLAAFMLFGTITGFALIFWLTRPRAAAPALPGATGRWINESIWEPVLQGLHSIRNVRQARNIFLLSVAIAFTESVFYGLVGLALGIRTNPVTYLFLESAGNIGAAIPFTQGGTGSLFLIQRAFDAAGEGVSVATAYALALQALISLPLVLLGPLAAYAMRLTPGELFALRIHIDREEEKPQS
ncbi:MAG TPA: lysylphosphatidylglycerol synthase transmembrane domain-containing protein [Dehalococcoidia bacterium]|nr:lysylphosphatidylglycerol synthase transmembrane domain-containing protein [Dehalococcoidia bacterium]